MLHFQVGVWLDLCYCITGKLKNNHNNHNDKKTISEMFTPGITIRPINYSIIVMVFD